jgi:hypothetical protein
MKTCGLIPGKRFMVGQRLLHFDEDGRICAEDGNPIRQGLQEAIVKHCGIIRLAEEDQGGLKMYFLSSKQYQDYQAYKASGLTPAQVQDLAKGLLPDSEDRAPLPFSDYDRQMELAYDFHPAHEEDENVDL